MLIAQAVFTALLSGLFSGLFLFGLQEKKERTQAKLAKLEEAYQAWNDWGSTLTSYYMRSYDLASGAWDIKDYLSEMTERNYNHDRCHHKVSLLFDIYLRDGQKAVVDMLRVREKFSNMISAVAQQRLQMPTADLILLANYSNIMNEMLKVQTDGSRMIADKARALADRPHLLRSPFDGFGRPKTD